jgi:hypothetical protein
MNTTAMVLLVGIFGVPLVLLTIGHKLRRRTPRQQKVFWGMLAGYLVGALVSVIASVSPPEMWASTSTIRGAFGLWLPVVAPAIGAAVGAMRAPRGAA